MLHNAYYGSGGASKSHVNLWDPFFNEASQVMVSFTLVLRNLLDYLQLAGGRKNCVKPGLHLLHFHPCSRLHQFHCVSHTANAKKARVLTLEARNPSARVENQAIDLSRLCEV